MALAFAAGLSACSPIETWRSVSGASKNDPGPDAPFTGNLADAESGPYPNLASVPPPPSRATTVADRQKLAQSLVTDRTATAQAGAVPGGPSPAGPAATATAAKSPSVAAASGKTAAAASAAAPVGVTPAPSTPSELAGAAPAARTKIASAAPSPSAAATEPGKTAAKDGRTGPRKASEPPDPQPTDSNLQMPQVRMSPEPEAPRPPLPPPRLPAVAAPAASGSAPAAIASATPQTAPPVPVLPPVEPPPGPPKAEPKRAPAPMTVATLDKVDRSQIAQVAGLYKEQPGTVKVVGYAAAPGPGGDPLAVYHAALDRAQQIAKALADAGIPANKIQTEATPATSTGAASRVEIQFLP